MSTARASASAPPPPLKRRRPTRAEEIGRGLAEIAFELNEHSHGYIEFLYAFLKAGPLLEAWNEQFNLFGPNVGKDVKQAYNERIQRMGTEMGIGVAATAA